QSKFFNQTKDVRLLCVPQKFFTTSVLFEISSVNIKVLLIIGTAGCVISWESLPCDGHVRQAGAAAATRPRADPQLMLRSSFQEHLVTTHLLQHQDEELKHHDGKVAAGRQGAHRNEKLEGKLKQISHVQI
uniref:Uncharacterized protein n=1 Tax=Acanthochromis polyacanthus TaxID=80966 RepID=A0A3Q1HIG2_9TELE